MSDGGECFDGHLGVEPGGRRVLPAGLAEMSPGPALAVAVASVDRAACNGWELEELLKAQRRLVCWSEAECLTTVNELAHAVPGMPDLPAERSATPDPFTPEVLEPLLGWTGHHAHWVMAMATALPRLPRVREALASGGLEITEARVIVDRITDAKPDLWDIIENALFPKVLDLRGGLLRAKVEAEVVKADPEAAAKRHKAKRSARDVAIWPAVDGVADLSIRGLSADQAAEAFGYVDAVARAVKSTGDSRTLGQLRADVAASLLTGTADITDCPAPDHTEQNQADRDATNGDAQCGHAEQSDTEQSDTEQSDTEQSDTEQSDTEQSDTEQGSARQDAGAGDAAGQGRGPCAIHRFPDHDLHHGWCECGDCSPAPVTRCTVCGSAASGTPIHDTTAHDAAEHNAAEHHAGGENAAAANKAAPTVGAPAAGHIPHQSRRPDGPTDPPPGGRTTPPQAAAPTPPPLPWCSSQPSWGAIRTRAKVQLNVPLTTLMGLSAQPGELGGFGPVITEVARLIVANHLDNPEARFSVGVTHPVTGRLLHLHPIPVRFLRGLQAELVHARDPRCVWTTCRRPAATCHLDHNTEHKEGGETSVDNIAPLCPRHHKAKTERDWKLQQTGPGEHRLTDPHGRQYRSRTPSLTDPVPADLASTAPTAPMEMASAVDDLPPF
ncbi:HNH endonuclease signature motif containing protein [Actinopolymorpha singaporensis]|nr:HNH endonuclease signature motif containing protein [Actinopolymorpha singaporensis]